MSNDAEQVKILKEISYLLDRSLGNQDDVIQVLNDKVSNTLKKIEKRLQSIEEKVDSIDGQVG